MAESILVKYVLSLARKAGSSSVLASQLQGQVQHTHSARCVSLPGAAG